jgi:hypothetical protein
MTSRWCALALLAGCGEVSVKPDAPPGGDGPDIDAFVARCGDGARSPGEVCYDTAITRLGSDVTMDGHLADVDGDGDKDLIYLIGDQFKFHIQDNGLFSETALDGPTTFALHAVTADLGGDAAVELISAGDGVAGAPGEILVFQRAGTGYNVTGALNVNVPARAVELAPVTGGARPNLVALYQSSVIVATFDQNLRLTQNSGTSLLNGRDLAVGAIDEDALADVVVAAPNGVLLFRGTANGLGAVTNTPQNGATDGVAICDLDNDGKNDIVFTIAGTAGQIGVMKSVGGGAFAAARVINVGDLGKHVECTDVDGDGRADVIASRIATGTNAVLVALAAADGTLGTPMPLPIAIAPDYLNATVDFNGDGVPDIVTTNINTQTIAILPSKP